MKFFTRSLSTPTGFLRPATALLITVLIAATGQPAHAQTAVLTTLHNFDYATGGASPTGPLFKDSDGNFYGTTPTGGSENGGMVYEITPAGVLTALHGFTRGDKVNGYGPMSGVILASDGNFYGTTALGGVNNKGTIYQLSPAGMLTTLHSFNGTSGDTAFNAGLTEGADGNLYGTTSRGEATTPPAPLGTVFEITPAGVFTNLYSFSTATGGISPQAGLTLGDNGDLYGTTQGGGSMNDGTIFKFSPGGLPVTVYNFSATLDDDNDTNADGANPNAPLIRGPDGNFYGTTADGGAAGNGTFFKLTPGGVLTTIYSFPQTKIFSTVGRPGVTPGSDGNFYGAMTGDDTTMEGSLFQITPAGVFTTLYTFSGLDDDNTDLNGGTPNGNLLQGNDGNFYGTANDGGTSGDGTFFQLKFVGPVSLPTPLDGRDVAAGSTLMLTAAVDAATAANLDHVDISADGAVIATFDAAGNETTASRPAGEPTRQDAGLPIYNKVFTAPFSVPVADKIINLLITATDKLGHKTVSGQSVFHARITTDRPPVVAIDGLASGTHVKAGTTTLVNVDAHDPDATTAAVAHRPVRADAPGDGILAKMEYFLNGTKLAEATNPPYSFSFTPPAAGVYVLHAVATDGSGLATLGDPVTVQVDPAEPTVSLAIKGSGVAVKGGASAVVIVSRKGDTSKSLAVRYKAKGTAVPNVDYRRLPGTVTLPAGVAKSKITIVPIRGLANDGTRLLKIVVLPGAGGSYTVGKGNVKIKVTGND